MVRLQWLASLFVHIKTIHTAFISHFKTIKEEMKWDGRTILLERYLQLKLGIPELRIFNNDFENTTTLGYPCPDNNNPIGYQASSQIGIVGYTAYANNVVQAGFSIIIPSGLTYDEDQLKAEVNRYLIGGSDFEIIET
ncbi:hypothetical protein [Reichenbachiella sp.]|uniref:hypothetical protein n=1 Tax=Reichenbachiella sp. TaxID=2184521 RepID=UPI003B5B5213